MSIYPRYKKLGNEELYADHRMPNLIDLSGFENEESEVVKVLLQIVFDGRLRDGERLMDLQK